MSLQVSPAGAAGRDGRLRVGLRLLEVNQQSLLGLTHGEAVQLLRGAGDCLSVLVCDGFDASAPAPSEVSAPAPPDRVSQPPPALGHATSPRVGAAGRGRGGVGGGGSLGPPGGRHLRSMATAPGQGGSEPGTAGPPPAGVCTHARGPRPAPRPDLSPERKPEQGRGAPSRAPSQPRGEGASCRGEDRAPPACRLAWPPTSECRLCSGRARSSALHRRCPWGFLARAAVTLSPCSPHRPPRARLPQCTPALPCGCPCLQGLRDGAVALGRPIYSGSLGRDFLPPQPRTARLVTRPVCIS